YNVRCRESETLLTKVLVNLPGPEAGERRAAIDAALHSAESEVEEAAAAVQKAQDVLHETRVLKTAADQTLVAEVERGQARQEERQRLLAEKQPVETALALVVTATKDVASVIERELAGLVDAKT